MKSLLILSLAVTVTCVASAQTGRPALGGRSGAGCENETQSAPERNKALVARWYDALRNKDIATAQALVTDDWVIHGTHRELPRGPEGVKQWQAAIDTMWSVPRPATTEDMIAEGDKVVRRATVYRTYRLNNKESAMDGIFWHRIAHCKIAEVWRVVDALSSLQQIGAQIIMPAGGALSSFAVAARDNPGSDPFVGVFVLTGNNTHVGPGGRYAHARLEITRDSGWVTKSIAYFNDGQPERRFANRMREDGLDYPGLADNPNTMSIERTGLRSVRMTEKHNGHPVERYEEMLSSDGDTLTVSRTVVDQATGATRAIGFDVYRRVKIGSN